MVKSFVDKLIKARVLLLVCLLILMSALFSERNLHKVIGWYFLLANGGEIQIQGQPVDLPEGWFVYTEEVDEGELVYNVFNYLDKMESGARIKTLSPKYHSNMLERLSQFPALEDEVCGVYHEIRPESIITYFPNAELYFIYDLPIMSATQELCRWALEL